MRFVQIPVDALSRQALDGLIEEFVTRDGTDYGTDERSLDDKKDAVRRRLDCGEIAIVPRMTGPEAVPRWGEGWATDWGIGWPTAGARAASPSTERSAR